ncbi:hypothetical protein ACFV9C_41855 [Kribbella sp. NPDC059898]|uniref:hypothetical protein n=1 Tax=Kribbella sp. NPDC059898 TaxID=3346995 RepID=UPI003647CD8F
MTPDFTPDQRDALIAGRARDGVAAQQRLRALIRLWQDEPELKSAARELALADTGSIDTRKLRYPARIPLVLEDGDHDALMAAKYGEGTEAAAVIRALVSIWLSDSGLEQRVLQVAREQRAAHSRRQH